MPDLLNSNQFYIFLQDLGTANISFAMQKSLPKVLKRNIPFSSYSDTFINYYITQNFALSCVLKNNQHFQHTIK